MAIFEVIGPDGKTYEVEAPSMEAAAEAIGSFGPMPAGGSTVDPAAVDDFKARGLTTIANTAQGMAFGLGDEFTGLRAGLRNMGAGGEFGPAYRETRDKVRGDMATVNKAYPTTAGGGQVAGMAINALATAPLAMGRGLLQTMGYGGAFGAAEGALQGAGNADGGDIVGDTIKGGAIGLGAGLAAPALVAGVSALKNTIKDPITGLLNIASESKANRAIADALQRSGKSMPDIDDALRRAAAAGQPEFRVMDAMGLPGQRAASGIVRAGSQPGDEVAEFLATRQAAQPERVGSFVEDAFDVKGTTAAKTVDSLTAGRKAAADTAYDAARGNAAPVDVRSALGVIDARTRGMAGSGIAGDGIDSKLLGYRARLAGDGKGLGPDVTGAELSDFDRVLGVKQDIQDDIGTAVRAGRNNEVRELTKLVNELDAALEASSDMYRAANDGFRSASRVIDAVDEGSMMATRGRAADNVPRFGAMAAAEQDAARIGYGDRLLDQMERMNAPTANRAKPLQSPKRAAEANAIARDPTLYGERLARENAMWETQNRALGGSRTADNLADIDAMDGMTTGALSVARSASNLQLGDAVAKVAGMLAPIAKGQNEATRRLIAQALLSGDANVLAPVIRQAGKSSAVRRVLEAIIRQPMREGGEASIQ